MLQPDYAIVRGNGSKSPLLIMPEGFIYLRTVAFLGDQKRVAGQHIKASNNPIRLLPLFPEEELTDEDIALAAKFILLGKSDG
jgi:hypothetical protein